MYDSEKRNKKVLRSLALPTYDIHDSFRQHCYVGTTVRASAASASLTGVPTTKPDKSLPFLARGGADNRRVSGTPSSTMKIRQVFKIL